MKLQATLSFFFSRIVRSEALVNNSYFFFRTAVLRKLLDIRFYVISQAVALLVLVKMASKTVTRSIGLLYTLLSRLSTHFLD